MEYQVSVMQSAQNYVEIMLESLEETELDHENDVESIHS